MRADDYLRLRTVPRRPVCRAGPRQAVGEGQPRGFPIVEENPSPHLPISTPPPGRFLERHKNVARVLDQTSDRMLQSDWSALHSPRSSGRVPSTPDSSHPINHRMVPRGGASSSGVAMGCPDYVFLLVRPSGDESSWARDRGPITPRLPSLGGRSSRRCQSHSRLSSHLRTRRRRHHADCLRPHLRLASSA
jgi:hypothetical protein